MPDPDIRPFAVGDSEASVPLFRQLIPQAVNTGGAIRHFIESQPSRAQVRAWVAVEGDRVVGWANARLRWSISDTDVAGGWVGVLAERQGRGIGSRLYRLAEEHARTLNARQLDSFVQEDDASSRAFAARRGFGEGRREQYWELRLDTAALRNSPPSRGVEVQRLHAMIDRERDLFELFDAAHSDMPGDHAYALEYEEWLPEALGDPSLDLEVSAVVLVDGCPASFAWINSDREGRYGENEMTGTHPDFRRRGLARLAKETAIRWSLEAGLERLYTSNDTANADMLALNEHLGYRPTHVVLELAKNLSDGA